MQTEKKNSDNSIRLLDVQAVAKMLGVSSRHIYRLADSGRMPEPVKLGGAVRWDLHGIIIWIEAGCPGSGTKGGSR